MTKAQQHSLASVQAAIRLIEELIPIEQQRSSRQRRRKLESAHVTMRSHASTFGISFPMLSLLYRPEQYLEHAHLVAQALTDWLAAGQNEEDGHEA